MAAATNHKRLPPSRRHKMYPRRSLGSSRSIEISEFADVVNLKILLRFTDLAASGREPMDQLVALATWQDRGEVGEDCRALTPEWDPAEAGDQRLPSPINFNDDLEAVPRSIRCRGFSTILSRHLHDLRMVLASQGLEQ